MGYSLQEDYQPGKEIWLWLGICRSHSVILCLELKIETNKHAATYRIVLLQLILPFSTILSVSLDPIKYTRGLFPMGKTARALSGTKVKNAWRYTSVALCAFIVWC